TTTQLYTPSLHDALPISLSGLGQKPSELSYQPTEEDNGHGCGHNLLGTGSFAAACAVKNYLEKNQLEGTVQFFGCPGEEGGSGKDRKSTRLNSSHVSISY